MNENNNQTKPEMMSQALEQLKDFIINTKTEYDETCDILIEKAKQVQNPEHELELKIHGAGKILELTLESNKAMMIFLQTVTNGLVDIQKQMLKE